MPAFSTDWVTDGTSREVPSRSGFGVHAELATVQLEAGSGSLQLAMRNSADVWETFQEIVADPVLMVVEKINIVNAPQIQLTPIGGCVYKWTGA